MFRSIGADIFRAFIFVVPAGFLTARQVPHTDVKNDVARGAGAPATRSSIDAATYCLGSGRGLRSSLFLSLGD